jgi:hypothetical protein
MTAHKSKALEAFDKLATEYEDVQSKLAGTPKAPEKIKLSQKIADLEVLLWEFPHSKNHKCGCRCSTCTSIRVRPCEEKRAVYGIRLPRSLYFALKEIGPEKVEDVLVDLAAAEGYEPGKLPPDSEEKLAASKAKKMKKSERPPVEKIYRGGI